LERVCALLKFNQKIFTNETSLTPIFPKIDKGIKYGDSSFMGMLARNLTKQLKNFKNSRVCWRLQLTAIFTTI